MTNERTYTADEIATVSRELREAAGAGEGRFTKDQVLTLLGGSIRLLRERGFSDQAIADLCSGFDIDATADEIARHSPEYSALI
jgi:hypothetical protein